MLVSSIDQCSGRSAGTWNRSTDLCAAALAPAPEPARRPPPSHAWVVSAMAIATGRTSARRIGEIVIESLSGLHPLLRKRLQIQRAAVDIALDHHRVLG